MKYIIPLFFVLAATLGGLFYTCDWEARRQQERTRIEAIQASTDYQQAYARQLEAWK